MTQDQHHSEQKLNNLIAELGVAEENPRDRLISKDRVVELMGDSSIEVLGAVYELVTNKKRSKAIAPPLLFEDYYRFMTHYYERCFREDPKGTWCNSRYSAGWDLVNWFVTIWNNQEIPRTAVDGLKAWLAYLYKEGDAELRTCLENAVLEHLFEHKDIRKYFSDWEKDPVLMGGVLNAMEWVKGGGQTPLGKREWFQRAESDER